MHYIIDFDILYPFIPRSAPRVKPLQDCIKEKCLTNLQIVLADDKCI